MDRWMMQLAAELEDRLDALVNGECSEDAFIDELSALRTKVPDLAWDVVALLDQRYRRGQVPVTLFRSVESRIARRELHVADDRNTAVLAPLAKATPRAKPAMVARDPSADQTATLGVEAPKPGARSLFVVPPAVGLAPGRVLRDRYVIQDRLGSGGMGTVYKAIDLVRREHADIDPHVAVKVLHERTAGRPEVLAKLRREFYCAQGLSHHSIVKVFELDRDNDITFFTMEYIDGNLVSELIKRQSPPFPRAVAWDLIRQIGRGLAHAHSRKLIHADLKPQNIMLTKSGEVRILDFGTSSEVGRLGKFPFAVTPAYASCEQLNGHPAESRDDLYALACVSYELLTGQHPFQHQKATDARLQGLVPVRPDQLTGRQWATLQAGFAWTRGERSLPVTEWLAGLEASDLSLRLARALQYGKADGVARATALLVKCQATIALAKAKTHKQASSVRRAVSAARLPAELRGMRILGIAALAIGVAIALWGMTSHPRHSHLGQSTAGIAGGKTAPVERSMAHRKIGDKIVLAVTPAMADPPVVEAAVPPSLEFAAPEPSAVALPTTGGAKSAVGKMSGAKWAVTKLDQISLGSPIYRARAGANFVELHVRRATLNDANSHFVWNTEEGSALAGVDFAPQLPTTVSFAEGRQVVSVFVKLLPGAARRQEAAFTVAISSPDAGSTIGTVTKSAVHLSPSR